MKKNAILFGVLIALLGLTYIFQEKRVHDEKIEQEHRDRLFTAPMTSLELPHVTAVKKGESWWSGSELLSHNAFKQIEKKLSEIRKIKSIEGEWKTYFPHPVLFGVNGAKCAIGDFSLDRQGFYVSCGEKIYLAVIEGESTHLTQDESEIESIKLNELVTHLSKPLKELKENQLFRFYENLPYERVILYAEGSLPFELDFVKNTTSPAPIPGISVHQNLGQKFMSLLTQVNIREEVPFSEKLKFKKMAEVQFKDAKRRVSWELWLKDAKSADAYIIDPDQKRAFLMVGGTLRVFFVQLQDYWDKKIIPHSAFQQFSELSVEFIQGAKKADVIVKNREPLAFEVKGFKVEQTKLEELFQIIFNLGPRDQGDRVSNLSKTERQQVLSEDHLRLTVMKQELVLWRKAQELIVVNLTQGFKIHFNLLNENFRGTFEDVLK